LPKKEATTPPPPAYHRQPFLLTAIDERIGESARADAEKAAVLALFNKKWVGKEPILWLMLALIDNNKIKHAHLERFNAICT
jgi:hypothetical protein